MIRAAFAQFCPDFGNRSRNLSVIQRMTRANADADLIVYPELAVCGYEFVNRGEALESGEAATGETADCAASLARECNTTLVIGYAERAGDRVYNACLLATPGGAMVNYRKIHLFDREKERFDPGDAPPPVVDTPAGRVGLMICFDWYFPEVARVLALNGAQILAHPSNLVLDKCQRAMFARSVENHVFTITANRYGTETRAGRALTFTGASQILSPNGDTLAQGPVEGDHVGIAAIDPNQADDKHATKLNDLFEDRRPRLYRRLTE